MLIFITLLLLNNFHPVTSYRRAQEKKRATNYCTMVTRYGPREPVAQRVNLLRFSSQSSVNVNHFNVLHHVKHRQTVKHHVQFVLIDLQFGELKLKIQIHVPQHFALSFKSMLQLKENVQFLTKSSVRYCEEC